MGTRVAPLLQRSSTDCGAACLAMVLRRFGRRLPLSELRAAVNAGRDGATALALRDAAERYGLRAEGVSVDPEHAADLPVPCILFWKDRHFVVLEQAHRRWVRIVDPAVGRRIVSRAHFQHAFSGIAIVFQPAPGFTPDPPRAAAGRAPRARGLSYALAAAATRVALVLLGARLLDDVAARRSPAGWAAAALAALFVARLALEAARRRRGLRMRAAAAERRAQARLRALSAATGASAPAHERRAGAPNAVRAERRTASALHVLVCGGAMVAWEPGLGSVAIALAAGVAALELARREAADVLRNGVRAADARLRDHWAALAAGAAAGVPAAATAGAARRLQTLLERRAEAGRHVRRRDAAAAALASPVRWTAPAVLLLIGAWARPGGATAGSVAGIVVLSLLVTAHARRLVTHHAEAAGGEEIEGKEAGEKRPEPHTGPAPVRSSGGVELRDVSFAYGTGGRRVLDGVTLRVEPGSVVALAGPSGAGKSTLAALIAGLHHPAWGTVRFDGVGAERWGPGPPPGVAIVREDPLLIDASVEDNLRAGDPLLTAADLEWACEVVEIGDDLRALPMGLHTPLGPGGRSLSQGQRQKLALARAVARKPALLVLDHATSCLDAPAVIRIWERLRPGCTVVIVSNDPAVLAAADAVHVLRAGRLDARNAAPPAEATPATG